MGGGGRRLPSGSSREGVPAYPPATWGWFKATDRPAAAAGAFQPGSQPRAQALWKVSSIQTLVPYEKAAADRLTALGCAQFDVPRGAATQPCRKPPSGPRRPSGRRSPCSRACRGGVVRARGPLGPPCPAPERPERRGGRADGAAPQSPSQRGSGQRPPRRPLPIAARGALLAANRGPAAGQRRGEAPGSSQATAVNKGAGPRRPPGVGESQQARPRSTR